MPTAISEENFEAALGEVYDAVAADDYTSAKKWLSLAKIQFAGLMKRVNSPEIRAERQDSLDLAEKAVATAEAENSGGTWEIHSRGVI